MSEPHRHRILIVENDDHTLSTLQGELEHAGFGTQGTWSGLEALKLLSSGEFAVLLVDDYLPDLHAADFLARVGRLAHQPWIVVMRNCEPTANDARHFDSLGASAVVHKQNRPLLYDTVRSFCAGPPPGRVHVN